MIEEALQEVLRPLVREEVQRALRKERERWRWASVRQAAERLDMSEQAIYTRIHRGQIPSKKLDGRVYIDMNAVDSLIEKA